MTEASPTRVSALLIEDDPHERIAIRRTLGKNVHMLLECETAEEAIRYCREISSEFDVVISDLKLPGMDGLALYRILRRMKCYAPFILLTGHGSEQIAIEAMKAGVADYLVKASQTNYLSKLGPIVYQVVQHHRLNTSSEWLEHSRLETNEPFHHFLDQFPGLAFIKDEQSRLTYLNPAFERIFKIPVSNRMEKKIRDGLPNKFDVPLRMHDEEVLSRRESRQTIETIHLEGGARQFFSVTFPILQNDTSPVIGGLSIDITEQLKAEAQQNSFFSLSLDLMGLIGLDGYLKHINPAFEKLLGFTQEELLSQPLSLFIHPEDRKSTLAIFKQLTAENDTVDFHNRLRDIRGNYLWLEWRATMQTDERVIYAWARDITQRHHTMQSLRRYEQIVSTSTDFLCFIDDQDCLQAVNRRFCDIFNLPLREIRGRHIREFVGQEVFETALAVQLADCRNGHAVRFQHHLKFPKGDLHFMEVHLSPYLEPDGRVSGVTATWRDLTDQKRLEQHLTQTQKMESIGTFAGGIAHDFNNILMAILGWADMGSMKFPSGTPASRYFQQITIAGKRGRELVQQILTFSRQTDHNPRPVDLGHLIKECMTFLTATLPSNIQLRFVDSPKLKMVFADPVQFQRIIMNLCSNAEHALRPTGGTLTITLENINIEKEDPRYPPTLIPGQYIQMAFRDSGPGIPEHIRPKIFDPFFTTKPVGEGSGMGLSVVHGIVNNLNGHITVESSEGAGTTFWIAIPEYTSLPSLDDAPHTPLIPERPGYHLLFVDDEESITEIIKEFLDQLGYTVTVCNNAVEALKIFRSHPQKFDCVITDQTMPTISGDQLAAAILQVCPNMPIILCTGYSHTIDREKALERGITAFLDKPILLDQLSRTVAEVLSHAQFGKTWSQSEGLGMGHPGDHLAGQEGPEASER
jgi:two-component system, cell cycle sensor histidine kinase and response regulator CckA